MRHGESLWNRANRFTGWADPDLSPRGCGESRNAGRALATAKILPDVVFTSMLRRSIRTAWLVLEEMDRMWVPVVRDWRLNGRHYGDLQGRDKAETIERFGRDRVQSWRRSWLDGPPKLAPDDPRHPSNDRRYASIPTERLPAGESLREASARLLEAWNDAIAPRLRDGATLLLVSHGNLSRALVRHIEGLSDEELFALEIPTATALVYELDPELRPRAKRVIPDGR